MITLYNAPVCWTRGAPRPIEAGLPIDRGGTMSYGILRKHAQTSVGGAMQLRFDALISHDITYVGIVQTALASGLTRFPVPYALTNCHNSLCAVGGTINADDHLFGLSAARRFGGIFVPPDLAVIHQYARETMAGCGRMLLGSDSHSRYGPLGTMGIGEGGPELVKQLLGDCYELTPPRVVLVYLTGSPERGVGPHDVAIELCGKVYKSGFVKNAILEFAGPGISKLPMDYRLGIDVMTTETACLSSVWQTDGETEIWLTAHGRPSEYKRMEPSDGACYDAMIEIDLSSVEPMAALPFHPSDAYTLRQLITDGGDIFRETEKRVHEQFDGSVELDLTGKLKHGRIEVEQGVIAGCAGGMYDNLSEAAAIMDDRGVGDGYFSLSFYPSSVPVALRLMKHGISERLLSTGAIMEPCFCGPCFGAGEVPPNGGISIRHTTRNFPNREGSKPSEGQLAAVILMDSRSIAATAKNHGLLTPATEIDYTPPERALPEFDGTVYENRVYYGLGKPTGEPLKYGPNITPWPEIAPMPDNLLIELAAVIRDEVTTTDELIPSGDTSSYRSNPLKLATFTLSRREPEYVSRAVRTAEKATQLKHGRPDGELLSVLRAVGADSTNTGLGSAIFANKPGDGSAREQAASCQRVLGGCANFCYEYATKRYRSNCINWGILPFTLDPEGEEGWQVGDYIYVPDVRDALTGKRECLEARLYRSARGECDKLTLHLGSLTDEESQILLRGCLMNWYAEGKR